MFSRLTFLMTLLLMTIGLHVSADAPQVHYLDDHLSLIVQHAQGWGVLGVNVAAHDTSGVGQPLQIGSVPFKRGLGLHASGQTLLELDGQYQTFSAQIGIHKQPQNAGTVHFTVLADGKKVYKSGLLRNGDKPKPIEINVKGVQMLELVVDDASDGVMCDAFDLCDARLVVDPNGVRKAQQPQSEIGRFAQLMEWDGHRTEGCPNARTEEFPESELFLGTPVKADNNGLVEVNPINGLGCVGLEWLERRRVSQVELPLPSGCGIKPEQVTVQQWVWEPKYNNGGSRWQGTWVPMDGEVSVSGDRVILTPASLGNKNIVGGVLKVRWLISGLKSAVKVGRPAVYTRTQFNAVNIELKSGIGKAVTVQLYNCYIADKPATTEVVWDTAKPLKLSLLSALSAYSPQDCSRLVLKWANGGCGIRINDLIDYKRISAPSLKLEAGLAPLSKYKLKTGKSILDKIETMPEQTLQQAIKHLSWPEEDTGPTLLSLAAGQHKVLLERSGEVSLDWSPSMLSMVQGNIGSKYQWVITPQLGVKPAVFVSRTMLDGYLPSPQIMHKEGSIQYTQSSCVLPYGQAPLGAPRWYRDGVVYVSQITVTNAGKSAGQASVKLSAKAGGSASAISADGELSKISLPNGYTGYIWSDSAWQNASSGDVYTATAQLNPAQKSTVWLVVPSQPMNTQQVKEYISTTKPADELRKYWGSVEKGAVTVSLPDTMLQNMIKANRIHCWIAARNQAEGQQISPWIASTYYGPLESEAHSVIRGMMVMGEGDFAQRGLQFFENQVNAKGYLTTGYTLMGTGWHLWCLGEYASMFNSADWVKSNAETISRTCQWIIDQRHKTMHTYPDGTKADEWGLMPPGVMADWDVYAYYFYMNGYYYAGLKNGAQALASINAPEAAKFNAEADDMRECILRAFNNIRQQAPLVRLASGEWVPMYPTQAYCPGPVVEMYPSFDAGRSWCYDIELGMHHLVPFGVMAPSDPAVMPMLKHMEDTYFLKSGWNRYDSESNEKDWFNRGGFSKVQPYYSRHAEIYAMENLRAAFIRTYFNNIAALLNKEDLSVWEHFFFGAFNKTHETGGFLHQSRLMLLTDFDDTLCIAPYAPAAWYKGDKPITVGNMPSRFGNVSYEIRPHQNPFSADVSVSIPSGVSAATNIDVFIPVREVKSVIVNGQRWSKISKSSEGLVIDLKGLTGNVEIKVQ